MVTERPCESNSPIFGSPGPSESAAQHCQVAHENDLTFSSRNGRVDPRGIQQPGFVDRHHYAR